MDFFREEVHPIRVSKNPLYTVSGTSSRLVFLTVSKSLCPYSSTPRTVFKALSLPQISAHFYHRFHRSFTAFSRLTPHILTEFRAAHAAVLGARKEQSQVPVIDVNGIRQDVVFGDHLPVSALQHRLQFLFGILIAFR